MARTPSRRTLSLVVLVALATASCVSKEEHEALQAQLTACEQDKRSAQDAASGFERRLSTDTERWETLRADLGAVLPQMREDFEAERKRIIEMVPAQVRKEVGSGLDRHFANVSREVVAVQETVTSLRDELAAAREEVTQLRGQTASVETKVDRTQSTLTGEVAQLQSQLEDVQRRASALVARLTDFDRAHLECADCVEKLKMKEHSRQQLLALHGELVKGLSALQGAQGAFPSTSGQ